RANAIMIASGTKRSPRIATLTGLLAGLLLAATAAAAAAADQTAAPATTQTPIDPVPDALTFRPTVVIRHPTGQGSGTVIASIPGEALVLTAAHVTEGGGAGIVVDFHRYNLGVERTAGPEAWPVSIPAELVAFDTSADVAVLRLKGKRVLPFVARLARPGDEPASGAVVTSVGIDGGEQLRSWMTRVSETAWMSMSNPEASAPRSTSRSEIRGRTRSSSEATQPSRALLQARFDRDVRPFLLTERAPVPGRSGGGLFDAQGALVGLCVGRIEGGHDRGLGLFASGESVRTLLREHGLDATVARSERLHGATSR
ncbi:MAG: serine protease, partial [Isosphaeraceae bacterium]